MVSQKVLHSTEIRKTARKNSNDFIWRLWNVCLKDIYRPGILDKEMYVSTEVLLKKEYKTENLENYKGNQMPKNWKMKWNIVKID